MDSCETILPSNLERDERGDDLLCVSERLVHIVENARPKALTSAMLAQMASEARISIPDSLNQADLTLDVLLSLLKAQSPTVAWAPPVNKATLGEPPTQYDHHTQMLIDRLIF